MKKLAEIPFKVWALIVFTIFLFKGISIDIHHHSDRICVRAELDTKISPSHGINHYINVTRMN